MIYKELSLKNFSSYRSAKFNFQTDDKKNVAVIYGETGMEKAQSSMVLSLLFKAVTPDFLKTRRTTNTYLNTSISKLFKRRSETLSFPKFKYIFGGELSLERE
ncbi:hypothetical protein [Peribacillus frigoritolerans]|uniref:hypothetical protein n=1 Tax=Peribacillus frigoritolerans TaxID=450367 RepID=UPI001F4FC0D2|nr:hypothetical protein [Peribacillus frigoritolerans]MCK2020530.1 hypothetical protein [Peribacillus frigoritolerans]